MPAIGLPANIRTCWIADVELSNAFTMYFSTGPDVTFNNNVYQSSPVFLGVGNIPDNIRASDTSVALAFVGIDPVFKQQLLSFNDEGLNGRVVNAYRVFFDENWIQIGQPHQRFSGIIDTMAIDDEYPYEVGSTDPVSFSVTLSCRGIRDILRNRIAGAFTNDESHKTVIDPTDNCMAIVPSIRDRDIILGGDPRSSSSNGNVSVASTNVVVSYDEGA